MKSSNYNLLNMLFSPDAASVKLALELMRKKGRKDKDEIIRTLITELVESLDLKEPPISVKGKKGLWRIQVVCHDKEKNASMCIALGFQWSLPALNGDIRMRDDGSREVIGVIMDIKHTKNERHYLYWPGLITHFGKHFSNAL